MLYKRRHIGRKGKVSSLRASTNVSPKEEHGLKK